MPRLTRAADHSKLWFAIAAGLAAGRAAVGEAGRGPRGGEPGGDEPAHQSGGQAGVGAAATVSLAGAVGPADAARTDVELAAVGPFGERGGLRRRRRAGEPGARDWAWRCLAGLVGMSRIATGAHYPGDVLAGFGIGAAVAVLGWRVVPPVVPTRIADRRPAAGGHAANAPTARASCLWSTRHPAAERAPTSSSRCEKRCRARRSSRSSEGDDVEKELRDAAERAEVLAVGGGDGTVSCAAGVADEAGVPLAVFPGGTFNHFAKDIGCETVAKTVETIRTGQRRPASTWSASTTASW